MSSNFKRWSSGWKIFKTGSRELIFAKAKKLVSSQFEFYHWNKWKKGRSLDSSWFWISTLFSNITALLVVQLPQIPNNKYCKTGQLQHKISATFGVFLVFLPPNDNNQNRALVGQLHWQVLWSKLKRLKPLEIIFVHVSMCQLVGSPWKIPPLESALGS